VVPLVSAQDNTYSVSPSFGEVLWGEASNSHRQQKNKRKSQQLDEKAWPREQGTGKRQRKKCLLATD
jgi:hypothetical protein